MSSESPFWHRPDPLVAVTRIDPGYALLQEHFPSSWRHLVRVKTLTDAMTSLEAPAAISRHLHHRRIAPLLTSAAGELMEFAEAEESGPGQRIGAQARIAAGRLRLFAESGEWPTVTLEPPGPGGPWLYCGPIGTWAMHASRTPCGFLLVMSRPDLQAEPDAITADITRVRHAAGQALGGTVRFTKSVRPTMHVVDILLAGGEPVLGHKHFAHFFPLETPASSVDGAEFTIVFANIHASRLRRCSIELLQRYATGQHGYDDDVLRSSISWFRGHDLAHFWRLDGTARGAPASMLTPFESMTLEEAYADIIGLLSVASSARGAALSRAFAGELLRYLSRECSLFADSSAAALTIGWLQRNGVTQVIGTTEWLDAALGPLGRLGRAIHRVMWENREAEFGELRAALGTGFEFSEGLSSLYHCVPTDIEYTFG